MDPPCKLHRKGGVERERSAKYLKNFVILHAELNISYKLQLQAARAWCDVLKVDGQSLFACEITQISLFRKYSAKEIALD